MTIDFAIDLGTTNSLIASCRNGEVEIYRNPAGLKQTLPSVVAFRKERTLIGDKAREYLEKDPNNVIGGFKRKVGTNESYFIPNRNENMTPVHLSAIILKELREFIHTGEKPQSIVITIPASFDTIQSNATKQAGYEAGFAEVVLLQEPIAASLAFANKASGQDLQGYWLVYDLGGGTFDAALVSIGEEMRIIDHQGDNYLGGMDFDTAIIQQLIVPKLEAMNRFPGIAGLRSASNPYNHLYYILQHKAEEAKIMLSGYPSADVEFEITDADGEEHEICLTIAREEFEALIRPQIDQTIDLVRQIMQRNSLVAGQIGEVVMIGGSTYIPAVRETIGRELGICVNCSTDPTTAVAVGAAYYAATKTCKVEPRTNEIHDPAKNDTPKIPIKTAYAKHSRDMEEFFSAAVALDGLYRIIREDGGYDSGLKPFNGRIAEVLPLLAGCANRFRLKLYDNQQMPIDADIAAIEIIQGKYSIQGQPLPNDICLEVDDTANKGSLLEPVFEKNALLPLRRTMTRTINRTILKDSNDRLLINVVEGHRFYSPQCCVPIGFIEIPAGNLPADLIKGCDIEICFEMSESRDLSISAYISALEYEQTAVFSPNQRTVHTGRLLEELNYLKRECNALMTKTVQTEDFETAALLRRNIERIEALETQCRQLVADDVSDEKYQIEENKRKIAAEIDHLNSRSTMLDIKEEYFAYKADLQSRLDTIGTEMHRRQFRSIVVNESEWIQGSPSVIRRKIQEMRSLGFELKKNDFDWIVGIYMYYALLGDNAYTDRVRLKHLRTEAERIIPQRNVSALLAIINHMYDLLTDEYKNRDQPEGIRGTGLS